MAQLGELHPCPKLAHSLSKHPLGSKPCLPPIPSRMPLVPVLAWNQVSNVAKSTSESPTASRLRMSRGATFLRREGRGCEAGVGGVEHQGQDLVPGQAIEYNGQTIHIAEEMNLTEMHKASGRNSNASPYQWSRREGAEFVKKMTLNGAHRPIMIRSQRGRNGGTFAHWQIGMEYARYLSPELAAVCNQIVKDFVDAKPEIAQSVTARTTQKGVARGFVRNQVLNIATGLESIYKHPMLL